MTRPPARLYLSALHKGSGKTSLSVGLAGALNRRGLAVHPYKRGPDYIDPGWLTLASGRPCRNLDYHTMECDEIRAEVAAADGDLALIEGNKGLHDGLDPDGRDSNAALAAELQAPIVLIVDARGMTRGIAPTVLGHAGFDPQAPVAGVILNRVGGARHERKLRQALERYTDLPVLGAVPNHPELHIEAPYLGLIPAAEQERAQGIVDLWADRAEAHLDLEGLRELAATAPPLHAPAQPNTAARRADVDIGIAHDRAFNFYYPGDLEALERAGARLRWIDLTADTELPAVDGLIIGGGFPERHAAELAANHAMKRAVAEASAAGLPIYAECGGLLYLCRRLNTGDGHHIMAGVFPLDAEMTGRPQGHGYMTLQTTPETPWSPAPGTTALPAHEFHYSRLREPVPEELPCAYRVTRGQGLGGCRDGLIKGNTVASYAHLRHTWTTPWAERFVAFVREQRRSAAPTAPC
ncbi:cobyrinate a,c-diamide synthase [Halorhodospira halophila]|uniref:Cobyrinate a,c-diamide synthase n=1 Tax=Halorhodospira halophila (strain DSM 244 / SL1) TaxID=349124 RepID=A1WYG5_HALHL|nr:cobyrinate a,c-diamide synthase [Halorhodospira halophila]ABM62727.1 cobyrinate a,c-diamide synthase [Halorhodospira halophila SL1]MBK1728408.1 cobyrinate a,c-diamide synthase [Halorhodospira halophila]